MALLEIDSVLKFYDERSILTDVYLKCEAGDVIGLLGRNGSGKSTFLEILFGTIAAEKFIRIDDIVYNKPYTTIGLISYLPQHDFIPAHLTVNDVAHLYLTKDKIKAFLNDEMLMPVIKTKISGLSGGELRYLEVKLLLNLDTKFVLFDEPFNGVAPVMIEKLKTLIKNASSNKGIILTDHDYNNVLDIATRCCLLFQGSLKNVSGKHDLVHWGYMSESKL